MVVKKTVAKKSTTKTATKQTSAAKVVDVKKPTVVVETKKTDRCECGSSCCCDCGHGLKILILVLLIVNIIISLLCLCPKKANTSNNWGGRSAWDLEALKVWWQENLEKLKNDLYGSEAYIQAQRESIDAYIQSLWIE